MPRYYIFHIFHQYHENPFYIRPARGTQRMNAWAHTRTRTHRHVRTVRTLGWSFKTLPYCTDKRIRLGGTQGRVRIREKDVNQSRRLVVHRVGNVLIAVRVREGRCRQRSRPGGHFPKLEICTAFSVSVFF